MTEIQEQLLRDLNNNVVRLNNLISMFIAHLRENKKPKLPKDFVPEGPDLRRTEALGIPVDEKLQVPHLRKKDLGVVGVP